MTALCLYAAILLMVASVVVNRKGERRVKAGRESLSLADKDLRALEQQFLECGKALDLAQNRLTVLDERVAEAEALVRTLERQLESCQKAPAERYYVFDRLEPRPGTIWEVPVRRMPGVPPGGAAMASAWRDGRTYLLAATTQREALERASQRFPRISGFEVGPATACRLFQTACSASLPREAPERKRA
ncbi:hypothetical protein [Azospirillum sp. sgz302134]